MANYETAPLIHHSCDKNKFINKANGFIVIPDIVYSAICKQLDSKKGAQLKLLLFYIGCAEGFGVPLRTVMERLGFTRDGYYRARAGLQELGWITITDTQIIINYNEIVNSLELP